MFNCVSYYTAMQKFKLVTWQTTNEFAIIVNERLNVFFNNIYFDNLEWGEEHGWLVVKIEER